MKYAILSLLVALPVVAQPFEMPAIARAQFDLGIPKDALAGLEAPAGRAESGVITISTTGEASYPGQQATSFDLDLSLVAGPSFGLDNQVVSIFVDAFGDLEVGGSSWALTINNTGPYMAKAHHHPDSGHLGLFIPLAAERAGMRVWMAFVAKCQIRDKPYGCEAMGIGFDAIRQRFSPELLPAPLVFGWAPVDKVMAKGLIPDCCFGPMRCCCHDDCSMGGCPSGCTTCSVGGCDFCNGFIGCGLCGGC